MPKLKLSPRLNAKAKLQRCNFPDCKAACCVYGTWVDQVLIEEILKNAEWIQTFLKPELRQPELWFQKQTSPDPHALEGTVRPTTVVTDKEHYGGTACIFLRGDYKCALQVAGEAKEEHPWRYKPFYCILHPLEIDEARRLTLDNTHLLLAEPASCIRPAKQKRTLKKIFKTEIEYFFGK